MKMLIVSSSNFDFSPYVRHYLEIIEHFDIVKCDLISWERLTSSVNLNSSLNSRYLNLDKHIIYRELINKNKSKRGLFSYAFFISFVNKVLKQENYDAILIFSVQLAALLRTKKLKLKKILDIRDYHWLVQLPLVQKQIKDYDLVSISSGGFIKWLPVNLNYLINYNYSLNKLSSSDNSKFIQITNGFFNISYIGLVRDIEAQSKFVEIVSKHDELIIHYYGRFSSIGKSLKQNLNSANNLFLHGEYRTEDESKFYQDSNFINVIMNDDINSRTLIPNRLLNAVYYNRPVIVKKNSYTAEVVAEYGIGIVLDWHRFVTDDLYLVEMLKNFDYKKYHNGRTNFLEHVHNNQLKFIHNMNIFLIENNHEI